MTGVLRKRQHLTQTDMDRETMRKDRERECHVKIGVICPQIVECLGLPETGRGKEGCFLYKFQRERDSFRASQVSANILLLLLLASRNARQ